MSVECISESNIMNRNVSLGSTSFGKMLQRQRFNSRWGGDWIFWCRSRQQLYRLISSPPLTPKFNKLLLWPLTIFIAESDFFNMENISIIPAFWCANAKNAFWMTWNYWIQLKQGWVHLGRPVRSQLKGILADRSNENSNFIFSHLLFLLVLRCYS